MMDPETKNSKTAGSHDDTHPVKNVYFHSFVDANTIKNCTEGAPRN